MFPDPKIIIVLLELCILKNFALVEKRNTRVLLAAPVSNLQNSKKIVGGEFCNTREYPFAVAVFSSVVCGGTLVTLEWVVTAGHCVETPYPQSDLIAVRSGYTSGERYIQLRDASKTLVHEKFRIEKLIAEIPELRYDIALIMVDKPFKETSHLKPVKLPQLGFTEKCTNATVVGMGVDHIVDYTKDFVNRPLKCVNLKIVNRTTCAKTYPDSVVDESIICTMEESWGKDACQGDSGGPMLCNKVLIGIISYGKGCGMPNHSASFTRVEKYLNFINHSLRKNPKDIPSAPSTGQSDRNYGVWKILCTVVVFALVLH